MGKCTIIFCIPRYFHDFGLGGEICEGLILRFCDVFITINSHILKWKFSRGLTREIHENKSTAKITTYTVSHGSYNIYVAFLVSTWQFGVYLVFTLCGVNWMAANYTCNSHVDCNFHADPVAATR